MGSLHSARAGCSQSILSAHLEHVEHVVPSRAFHDTTRAPRHGVKCILTRVEIPTHLVLCHTRVTAALEVAGRQCVSRRVHSPRWLQVQTQRDVSCRMHGRQRPSCNHVGRDRRCTDASPIQALQPSFTPRRSEGRGESASRITVSCATVRIPWIRAGGRTETFLQTLSGCRVNTPSRTSSVAIGNKQV
jgi:hypothetical protein